MKVQFVTIEGAEYFDTVGAFQAAAPRLSLTSTGITPVNPRNPALGGLPTFAELAGPMGPSSGTVRYETWAANELYSQ